MPEERLTVVIATVGRPTLRASVLSAQSRLPEASILLVPSKSVSQEQLQRLPGIATLAPTESLYSAWNSAVNQIESGRILFLNDDDYLAGEPLEGDWARRRDHEVINLPFRRSEAPPRPSLGRIAPCRTTRMIDLFHSNGRGNINSYLWPRSLFSEVGPFDESLRIAADIDWMSRSFGRGTHRVVQVRSPTYVQTRRPGRLSDPSAHGQRLSEEVRVVADSMRRRGRTGPVLSAALELWVRSVERRVKRSAQ